MCVISATTTKSAAEEIPHQEKVFHSVEQKQYIERREHIFARRAPFSDKNFVVSKKYLFFTF